MAIVGTAFVRLKVIGDKLAGDIGKQVKSSIEAAGPDLDAAGTEAGSKVGKKLGEGVEKSTREGMGKIADKAGKSIGDAFGDAMGKSISGHMRDSIRRGLRAGKAEVSKTKDFFQPVTDKFDKFFGKKTKHWQGLLGKAMTSGMGALVLAAPSAVAFAGAAIGAMAATAITAISALGPALAGAGAAGLGVFAALKISTKLLGLAMKYPSDQLTDFQDRLDTFKGAIALPIQGGLLSGLNASMRLLTPVVDHLRPQLEGLGIAAGDVAIGFADAVRQGANMDRLSRILDTNNQFIRDAGGGASALGQAFIIILDNLRPVTAEIGEMIGQAGQWLLATTQASDANGTLAGFIERSWNATKYFVGILVDFAVGLYNVFSAAFQASGGMTTTLHDIAENFRAWTGDPANRERMVDFFTRMRDITGQLLGVFGQLAGGALSALDSTSVEKFSTALQTLVSVGGSIITFFEQIREASGPKLQEAFQNFADMMMDLANSGVIGTVASALSNLFQIISLLLNIPGVSQLLAFGAGLLVIFKTISLLWTILGPIVEILWVLVEVVGGALVAAFGWIPVLIGAVVIALIWFFTQTEIGRQIVQAVWNAIVAAFMWAKDAIMTALSAVWGFLQQTWAVVQQVAGAIWGVIQTVFTTILNFYISVWTAIYNAVSTAVNAVWNVIRTVFMAIWNFIFPLLNTIYGIYRAIFYAIYAVIALVVGLIILVVVTTFTDIWNAIQTIWGAIRDFIVTVVTGIYDFYVWIFSAIYEGIKMYLEFIWSVIQTVWNAVWGFLQPIIQGMWNFIVGAWNAIYGAVSGALSAIWGAITSVWNGISGFITGVVGGIVSWVVGAWEGMVSGIKSAFDGVADFFGGVFSGIGDGIKGAINGVLGIINTGINFINDNLIDTANDIPFVDIPHIPQIPLLAAGGTVSPRGGGTLAMIAEAGRPERVEPLDPQGLSARDRAMIEYLGGGSGGDTNVVVKIGETELRGIVSTEVKKENGSLADSLVTGRKAS